MILPPVHHRAWLELAAPVVFLGIVDLLGTVFGWIADQLSNIWETIVIVIAQVWEFLKPILGHVWDALSGIWSNVLVPFWKKFSGWIERLQGWWDKWAKPITDILNKIAKFERAIWSATLGPIYDTISGFQKLLTLLHLQQTALGKQIDQVLQEVESKLQALWRTITAPLNSVIQLVQEWILDVDGTLRELLLIPSIGKHFAQIWNTWWTKSLPAITPAGQAVLSSLRQVQSVAQHKTNIRQALVEKAGPLYDAGEDGRQLFSQLLEGTEPADPDLNPLV